MTEPNHATDPDTGELAAAGGVPDVSSASTEPSVSLGQLNELAGRQGDNAFKSVQDFSNHYGNLKSIVGKKTEAPAPTPVPVPVVSDDKFVTKEELARRDFSQAHPEAKDIVTDVEAVAKARGVDLETAFSEAFKDGVEARRAREEANANEQAVGTTGASRVSSADSGFAELERAYKENPTAELAAALVRSQLGSSQDAIRERLR